MMVLVLAAVLLLCSSAPALAVDDDVPGVPLAVGASISQAVDAADPDDVYAVNLTAGQEVYIRCDPGNNYTGEGYIHLLVPGAPTIGRPEEGDEISFGPVMGGIPYQTKHGGYFHYIPATSGTYYLWVEQTAGTLAYKLSVERTQRTLVLAPDSDDIPGMALGPGTVTGVVSTLADHYDVYAVTLAAGKAATFELKALATLESYFVSTARLSLLSPAAIAVDETSGAVVAGPKEVTDASAASVSIQYTPSQSGTYYVLVEAGPFGGSTEGANFAYTLTTSGNAPIAGASFSDVPAGHPYYAAVTDLASQGIINGYIDGRFGLNDTVKRMQFAKMIVGTLGITPNVSTQTRFTDLGSPDSSGYPHKFVQAAYDHGITNGTNTAQTTYSPSNPIRRDQVVSMIVRAMGVSPGRLLDPPSGALSLFAGVGDPHGANLRIAEYNGLLEGLLGMGPGWSVTTNATRGEVAQMLHNLLLQLD